MCRKVTNSLLAVCLASFSLMTPLLRSQSVTEWRRLGNAAVDLGLASLATGPVDRVWYSADATQLYARTPTGKVFVTDDFEQWRLADNAAEPPPEAAVAVSTHPEDALKLRRAAGVGKVYGLGVALYRSDDGGASWTNLTQYRGTALLGAGLSDLAVSPRDPEEVAVAGATGVWRSADGGLSWTGLNQFLPNLPVKKIIALPSGASGLRIELSNQGSPELEWSPGQKSAWRVVDGADLAREEQIKSLVSRAFKVPITAVSATGAYIYAGSADGQLWSSSDRGNSWSAPSDRTASPVESILVNPKDPRVALATLGARNPADGTQSKAARVLKTMNGGLFWDDLTANLTGSAAHGITADFSSGSMYVATDAGVFMTAADLGSAGSPTPWTALTGNLPSAAAMDVKLDAGGNQLFVALNGLGVYSTIAPHRVRDIRVVSAADLSARPAAPGGLLSVIGARVQSAQAAGTAMPILDANETASQVQVPFEAQGNSVSLSLQAASGSYKVGLALQTAAPAIFVDPDGSPLVLDAESGVLLDSSKPARSRSRIQILATGLGRVTPDWPTGVSAPLTDPPRVQARVRAFLDGAPLPVTRAILAPGYIGFYLIETELPAVVNEGPSELHIDVDGQASNPVRLYVSQ